MWKNQSGGIAPEEGILPVFLTLATQKLFQLRPGENITSRAPFRKLSKDDVIGDIESRGVISDFYPVKEAIQEFNGSEIVLVWDEEQKFSKNFYLCLTDEAARRTIKRFEEALQAPKEKKDVLLVEDLAPEESVIAESVIPQRELLALSISRKRRDFGAPYKFSETEAHDSLVECRPFRTPNFDLAALTQHRGVQAVPPTQTNATQTPWFPKRNRAVEVTPLQMEEEQRIQALENWDLHTFLINSLPMIEECISQNTVVDIYRDDLSYLAEDDVVFGDKGDTLMKEFQNFTDFELSKGKSISALDWSPTGDGVIAVSCTNPRSETEDNQASSVVLIWDFADPIHPSFVLEAPSDVLRLKYHSKYPQILIGGCTNGQIVIWNTRTNRRKTSVLQRSAQTGLASSVKKSSDGDDDNRRTVSLVPILSSSALEHSHRKPVTDLQWLSDVKITASGKVVRLAPGTPVSQFYTASVDGNICVWDIEEFVPRDENDVPSDDQFELDLKWKPVFTSRQKGSHRNFPYALSQVCISKIVGEEGQIVVLASTEEGEMLTGSLEDIMKEESSAFKICGKQHYGYVSSIQQSPFFSDIFLSCGDWTLNIWNATTDVPLLSSPCASSYITVARWSPTRPSVIFLGKSDGSIDIWDVLDKSHLPSLTQALCSCPIVTLEFHHQKDVKSQGQVHLLAVGDFEGRLHIVEIPRNVMTKVKQEKSLTLNFFLREDKRVKYMQRRRAWRKEEEARKEETKASPHGPSPSSTSSSSSSANSLAATGKDRSSAKNVASISSAATVTAA